MRPICIFLSAILLAFSLHSQSLPTGNDTTSTAPKISLPTLLSFTTPETDLTGLLKYEKLDSTLDDLQIVNPATRYFYNDLGNIGSASDPKLFHPQNSILTYFGNSSYDLYKWKPESIRFYKTNKRFSEVSYQQGGGKEQSVKISFAQNILKNWNAGFDFKRMGSVGFLQNGNTYHSNFDLFTWYHTPDNRYQVFASAIWNTVKNEVNGGIKNDSLVDVSNFSNAELTGLGVHLNDPVKPAVQHWRNHAFSLNHFFDIGEMKHSETDSTIRIPVLRIRHDGTFESASYAYFDNSTDSSFYQDYFFSSLTTDSLHSYEWKNKLSLTQFIELKNNFIKHINYQLAGGHQTFFYNQFNDTASSPVLDKSVYNTFGEGRINATSNDEKLQLSAGGRYVFEGVNAKNYSYDAMLQIPVAEFAEIRASAEQSQQSPSLVQTLYLSNHYIWNNDFAKVISKTFKAEMEIPRYHFRVGAQNNTLQSYIYFNTYAVPEQAAGTVKVLRIFGTKNFHLGKFRFNNTVWYQKTNADSAIHIPEFVSHHTLLYETRFFKKALLMQIGFDAHYTSGYYANAYSPATSIFFLQNEKKINSYPVVDFYVNMKIKTARVFLKLQNIGDNLIQKQNYQTLDYPMPGMVFIFGFKWRFFD